MCNACVVNSVMLWKHTRILKDIYFGPVIGLTRFKIHLLTESKSHFLILRNTPFKTYPVITRAIYSVNGRGFLK